MTSCGWRPQGRTHAYAYSFTQRPVQFHQVPQGCRVRRRPRSISQRHRASLRRILVKSGLNAGGTKASANIWNYWENRLRTAVEISPDSLGSGTSGVDSRRMSHIGPSSASILERVELILARHRHRERTQRVALRVAGANSSAADTNPCRALPAWCREWSRAGRCRARRAGPVRDRRSMIPFRRTRNDECCRRAA